jgi:regulator of chromosome condensation
MAPRARASAATKAATKSDAPAKRAAPAKKTAAETKTTTAAATRKAASATTAASKKRKADAEPEAEVETPAPKAKKSKTATADAKPAKSAARPTKTPKAPSKTAVAKANAAKAAPAPKAPASRARGKKAAPEPAPQVVADAAETEADATQDESAPEGPKTNGVAEHKPAPKAPAPAIVTNYPKTLAKPVNRIPTQRLDIFVFGEGGSGELGLGSKIVNGKSPIDVKRPRFNQHLAAAGVVQIAAGGMHGAAITADNKLLTWGVNDQGALGRDTKSDKDGDDDESDDEESGLSPLESTPAEVSPAYFTPGTRFVQVVCSDSATFVLTEDGRVYGWGTFRANEGLLGFNEKVKVQWRPAHLPTLKNIASLATGNNHVLAIDHRGVIYAWGCGQQNQLGRRVIERFQKAGLVPAAVGLPRGNKMVKIACGSYHSFAVDKDGKVYAWGLNNYGNTGISEGIGEDDAAILQPTLIEALESWEIKDVAGGEHHSVACTVDGKVLAWGRADAAQIGIPHTELNETNAIVDENGKPRIVKEPALLPQITDAVSVSAGIANSFAITDDGKAYSWGFSANYQTGQGTDDDIEVPTLVDNTAVRGKKIVFAGAGGQFSILAALPS